MFLTVLGLNHTQAGIHLREKLAFPVSELPQTLEKIKNELPVEECLLLSTCNRIETYLVHSEEEIEITDFLSQEKGVPREEISSRLYRHKGGDAARHLFRVVSSLDSMVVGEDQILHQVKEAYQIASAHAHTSQILNQLFQQALHVGKRIRTETGIGEGGVSVPSLGVKLAGKVFEEVESKKILFLGAGETGRLALEAFRNEGATNIMVANRTVENAQKISTETYSLDQIETILPKADIVVAALSDQEYLITSEQVEAALQKRQREPIFFLDLALPRNIHPGIKSLEDAYLFNLDDLEIMSKQNIQERRKEMEDCTPIIQEEVEQFLQESGNLDLQQILGQLHQSFHEIGEEELKKSLPRLKELNQDQIEEIQYLIRRTIGKLLHSPTSALKKESPGAILLDLTTKLFGLSSKKEQAKPERKHNHMSVK